MSALELLAAHETIQARANGKDQDGNPYLEVRNFEHVAVLKVFVPTEKRFFYRKTFKGNFATWAEHENNLILFFEGQKTPHVVELQLVKKTASGQIGCVETRDAGLTIDEWLGIPPVYANNLQLAHPFMRGENLLRLVQACLSALFAIHRQGVIHCDIKADNICLPFTPMPYQPGEGISLDFAHLKLIDFSFSIGKQHLALRDKPLPLDPESVSAAYQSPLLKAALRQTTPEAKIAALNALDYRVDFYSLGFMLQEIQTQAQTGQAPFFWDNEERGLEGKRLLHEIIDKLLALGKGESSLLQRFSTGLPHQGMIDKLAVFLNKAHPAPAFTIQANSQTSHFPQRKITAPTPIATPVAPASGTATASTSNAAQSLPTSANTNPTPQPPFPFKRLLATLASVAILGGVGYVVVKKHEPVVTEQQPSAQKEALQKTQEAERARPEA